MSQRLSVRIMLITLSICGAGVISLICSLIQPSCGDFIAELREKPKDLEFIECRKTKEFQLNVLEARYKVPGKDTAAVEKFLHQNFQMAPLKFLCCGWEPVISKPNGNSAGDGHDKDSDGYYYKITMTSGETLISDRKNWQDIPFFYVSAIKYIEDP